MDYFKRLVNCGIERDMARWICEHFDKQDLILYVEEVEELHEHLD